MGKARVLEEVGWVVGGAMRRWEEVVLHVMVTELLACTRPCANAGDAAVSMTHEVPGSRGPHSGEGHKQYTHT